MLFMLEMLFNSKNHPNKFKKNWNSNKHIYVRIYRIYKLETIGLYHPHLTKNEEFEYFVMYDQ